MPFKRWIEGSYNRTYARLRCRNLPWTHRDSSNPIVRDLHRDGYAIARTLIDPQVINDLYAVYLKKLEDSGESTHVRNPTSTHPEFVGKINVSKLPTKFPEALGLFDSAIADHVFEFFRSDFMVHMTEAFRINALPEGAEAAKGSFYSEDWHLDSFQPSDTLKVFVPLHTIGADDGPTHLLDRRKSVEVLKRESGGLGGYGSRHEIKKSGGSQTIYAEPGDVYFAQTNYCFHRAGIPMAGRSRDILIFRLRPWRPGLLTEEKLVPGRVRRLP